jgi:DNA (cytosine-5)-methyltransferase 1
MSASVTRAETAPRSRDKPPYRVPSMAEIDAIPDNGFRVASTFSGCGGSCLGYRLAGFRVVWANEFIDEARATYAANASSTILDPRDIRTITAADVLETTGLKQGELDLFDGSPPCASFSTAGKREKSWGKVKSYSDKAQRTDDLFFEYARLVRGIRPKTFVAENVSGLVKGTAKGYFLEILAELKAAGYRVEARVCDAQWLGVPQARQRLIFVGVRDDLGLAPVFPEPLAYRYSIRDALPALRGKIQVGDPSHYQKPGSNSPRGETFSIENPCPTVQATKHVIGGSGHTLLIEPESSMTGYAVGAEWDRLRVGEQSTRYFSLVRTDPERPCPTVTQRGGDKTVASVAHPYERRKFTIAELRRICGFPDDFFLTGSYAQQWERLGRAVPPVMMAAVAAAVRDGVLRKIPCAG